MPELLPSSEELPSLSEELLLDVDDGDDPVAVPDLEAVEDDEEDETKGFESEEIEAFERSS